MEGQKNKIIDNARPSLTEWMQKINFARTESFRQEDNTKRDRLEILYQTISLPYDRPERLTARDITDRTPLFQDIIRRKGRRKCALRLIPINSRLPKQRIRGKTLQQSIAWFKKQKINPDEYRAEVVPHSDRTLYSAAFLIADRGIWGEIIRGPLWMLTEGICVAPPVIFFYDFKKWRLSAVNPKIKKILQRAVGHLRVTRPAVRSALKRKIKAMFTDNHYLKGYYEFVIWPKTGLLFIDYNRVRARMTNIPSPVEQGVREKKDEELSGFCASAGVAKGRVVVVKNIQKTIFARGSILVCETTSVNFLPLMKKAAAIVTEQGAALSHPAVISRELKIPCVIQVKNATRLLKNGELIKVDATSGIITRL